MSKTSGQLIAELKDFIAQFNDIFLKNYVGIDTLFRGESKKYGHFCQPQLIRKLKTEVYGPEIVLFGGQEVPRFAGLEDQMIKGFMKKSFSNLNSYDVPKDDLEWLALAQHYGLPTRLLDWTTNPMVALFFAVERNDSEDGVLYRSLKFINVVEYDELEDYSLRAGEIDDLSGNKQKDSDDGILGPTFLPLSQRSLEDRIIYFRPKYTDRRFENQRTVLACPANYEVSTSYHAEEMIVIKADIKPYIRHYLSSIGIDSSFIYPGLAGGASSVASLLYDEQKHTPHFRKLF